ncbi:MAG: glycoside hydrolase family 31 protein [Bacteroidales bacterium]|nr:glycoside hydrolase family 31 protein [Bacteroidales bacterium]
MKRFFYLVLLAGCSCLIGSCSHWKDTGKSVVISLEDGVLTLSPTRENAIRVQFAPAGVQPLEELVFVNEVPVPPYRVSDKDGKIVVSLSRISAVFDKHTKTLHFLDSTGNIILQEKENGRILRADSVRGMATWRAEQQFLSPEDEFLFGTGQFQDGYLNIRGLSRRLTQVNTQISIPFILSNKGYGLLWHNYGLTDFNPADSLLMLVPEEDRFANKDHPASSRTFTATLDITFPGKYALLLDVGQRMARRHDLSIDSVVLTRVENYWLPPTMSMIADLTGGKHLVEVHGEPTDTPMLYYRHVIDETVFRSPVSRGIDYTVFAGNGDEVVNSYRQLSGQAPLMPRWALGYIHCRERFHSQQELLETACEFRHKQLPMDIIVQDWQYWGNLGWNAMQFDTTDYPDPKKMVDELHDMNARLMLSVWSKSGSVSMREECEKNGYYIPGTEWVDFFNPKAAECYWKYFTNGLLKPFHIDAWWQDATEPENDDLAGRMINDSSTCGEVYRNVYPLFVNRTVYENARKDEPDKRVMILTRSGFSGMQRYAAAVWSGDVGNDWETLRRQISGGLGYMASGMPWWTFDAGGFFRPGDSQYTDPSYHERFLRWFQTATFSPLQRVHGYGTRTEFWNFGKDVERIAKLYLDCRYRMLPYTYSLAAAITFQGYTLMRPLVFDFPNDKQALEQRHEFTFGTSLLVAPVTEPAVTTVAVYLPRHEPGWVDFWTGEHHRGGQTVPVSLTIEKIPLFVKSGTILPLGPVQNYTSEKPDAPWEIRIYPGADATFTIYEDNGENYRYEQGEKATFTLTWNDKNKTLTITERQGSFPQMIPTRTLNIVTVSPSRGCGIYENTVSKQVIYTGKKMEVAL